MPNAAIEQVKHLTLTPSATLLFCVVSVATLPFSDTQSTDGLVDIANELLLGLIATGAMVAVIVPSLVVTRRLTAPGWPRQWITLAVIVAGAMIRGTVIFWLGPAFDFLSTASMSQRVLNSVTTSLLWLVLLSLATNATRDFRSHYAADFRRLALTRAGQMPHTEMAGLFADLEGALKKVPLPRARDSADPGSLTHDMRRAARALENEIIARIKTQSRSLWRFDHAKPPRLRAGRLLALAMTRLDYSIVLVTSFVAGGAVVNLATALGWGQSLLRVAVATVILVFLHVLYRAVVAPRWGNRWVVNTVYVLIFGLSWVTSLGVIEYFTANSPLAVVFVVLVAVATAALPVLNSMLNLAGAAREEIMEALDTLSARARTPAPKQAVSTDAVATYLHNSLQSEVQNLIFSLRKHSSGRDTDEVTAASLARLHELVTRRLDDAFLDYSLEPLERLDDAIVKWWGILDIALDWEDRPASSGRAEATVVHIIEEIANNAVVHGEATELQVTVRPHGQGYDIHAVNNGHDRVGQQGQGSQWLDAFVAQPTGEPHPPHVTHRHYRV